jgi:hypothetical protein
MEYEAVGFLDFLQLMNIDRASMNVGLKYRHSRESGNPVFFVNGSKALDPRFRGDDELRGTRRTPGVGCAESFGIYATNAKVHSGTPALNPSR